MRTASFDPPPVPNQQGPSESAALRHLIELEEEALPSHTATSLHELSPVCFPND